jgi:hypothetical protein
LAIERSFLADNKGTTKVGRGAREAETVTTEVGGEEEQ